MGQIALNSPHQSGESPDAWAVRAGAHSWKKYIIFTRMPMIKALGRVVSWEKLEEVKNVGVSGKHEQEKMKWETKEDGLSMG